MRIGTVLQFFEHEQMRHLPTFFDHSKFISRYRSIFWSVSVVKFFKLFNDNDDVGSTQTEISPLFWTFFWLHSEKIKHNFIRI